LKIVSAFKLLEKAEKLSKSKIRTLILTKEEFSNFEKSLEAKKALVAWSSKVSNLPHK